MVKVRVGDVALILGFRVSNYARISGSHPKRNRLEEVPEAQTSQHQSLSWRLDNPKQRCKRFEKDIYSTHRNIDVYL